MNSVVFKASLFPIRIQQEDADTTTTYYDYLLNDQRAPWWSEILSGTFKAIKSLFADSEDNNAGKVDPHKLTKEQFEIVEAINHKVVCDVDKKTFVITIDVTDQDPVVAATIADSVQNRLQKFITDYRTRKARIDLDYNRKLLVEAEARYDKARQDYSAYSDAYRKSIFEDKNAVRQKLDTKLQIESRAYSQVATQVQVAEAKVQEETPAFTLLQPATVPVKKSGPKRAQICLIFLFLAAIVTTLYIFHKEGDLLTLLTGDDDEDDLDTPSLILNDSEYILVPKSSLKTPATE
jgi:capsular polysaccharide biosynthesis protein